ncbi:patatin-like phospholipase family protein [Methylobacterium durans]|uniref:PNPLA domain-containing protein n=1 Tax=Methylobacterium durans TaxID=2202825 RepID=A0A2U8W6X8_9HYPH|nr:patatin-like phospholipase family protein [Methylobacterium durans]AWN41829.1 hypothetical protein DK389_16630 [Methylobacterium durans]
MSHAHDPVAPLSTDEALAAERDALELPDGAQPAALCLSGGGVRSAAFGLGVLQALAARRLLGHFHYLSTVSGGGYIAAWLTRVVSGQLDEAGGQTRWASVTAAEDAISGPGSDRPGGPVHALRRYTSFLAPEPGLLSLDTLTGVLLWLRNTLINWFVLLPVFVAVAASLLLYAVATASLVTHRHDLAEFVLLAVGGACLLSAVYWSILGVPSHSHPDLPASWIRRDDRAHPFGPDAGQIRIRIIVPILVWCFAMPMAAAPRILSDHHIADLHQVFRTGPPPACEPAAKPCPPAAASAEARPPAGAAVGTACHPATPAACPAPPRRTGATETQILLVPGLSVAICLLAYGLAFLWESSRRYGARDARDEALARVWHVTLFRRGLLAWIVSALASAALLWWGIWFAQDLDIFWLVLLGPSGSRWPRPCAPRCSWPCGATPCGATSTGNGSPGSTGRS